jgi:hypothetical protein
MNLPADMVNTIILCKQNLCFINVLQNSCNVQELNCRLLHEAPRLYSVVKKFYCKLDAYLFSATNDLL